jgi:hypothetical protein
VIATSVTKSALEAHIRSSKAPKALVVTHVTKEDAKTLEQVIQTHLKRNKQSIVIVLPA